MAGHTHLSGVSARHFCCALAVMASSHDFVCCTFVLKFAEVIINENK